MRKCPRCGSDAVRRVRRDGALELFSCFIRLCPFRCQLCTHRFHRFAVAPRCWKAADRRQYERLATKVRAVIIGRPSVGNEVVTDLSLGGCRLHTEAPLSAGALLHLRLQPTDREREITVQAVLVRSVYAGSLGLEFLALDPRQKQNLSRLVRTILTGHSSAGEFNPRLARTVKA